jgi:hypothetical protein
MTDENEETAETEESSDVKKKPDPAGTKQMDRIEASTGKILDAVEGRKGKKSEPPKPEPTPTPVDPTDEEETSELDDFLFRKD